MLLRSPITALCVALLFTTFSCAHNPARDLTVTDEEVQVHEELAPAPLEKDTDGDGDLDPIRKASLFTRGADVLDEQEYYQAIGDTKTYEAVKSHRSTGSVFQGLGVTMAVIGFAVALAALGAYVASNDSIFPGESGPPLKLEEGLSSVPLYGLIGGGLLGAGGIAITLATAGRVRGDKLVFEPTFARKQLEVSLYGENGASPDDIKSLTFGAGDEGKEICGAAELGLAPLVARDAKGRIMKVSERADWFTWTTTPKEGLVDRVPDAPVLHSPVGPGFEHIDADVGLSIAVTGTQIGHQLTFGQTFACPAFASSSGTSGSPGGDGGDGSRGDSGNSRKSPGMGKPGKPGKPGDPGNPGKTMRAEVAWVTTAKRGRLALLVVDGYARLFDPSKARATVAANGGRGGRGGRGGHGGEGGSGFSGDCSVGGTGGTGGQGGQGGQGGTGGNVLIYSADRALLDAVEGQAEGGDGGGAGSGGRGGSGGSGSSCKKGWAAKGGAGSEGSDGSPGSPGGSGSVEEKLVPLSELSGVFKVISENPQLTLEGGAGVVPTSAPKRNKRR